MVGKGASSDVCDVGEEVVPSIVVTGSRSSSWRANMGK